MTSFSSSSSPSFSVRLLPVAGKKTKNKTKFVSLYLSQNTTQTQIRKRNKLRKKSSFPLFVSFLHALDARTSPLPSPSISNLTDLPGAKNLKKSFFPVSVDDVSKAKEKKTSTRPSSLFFLSLPSFRAKTCPFSTFARRSRRPQCVEAKNNARKKQPRGSSEQKKTFLLPRSFLLSHLTRACFLRLENDSGGR